MMDPRELQEPRNRFVMRSESGHPGYHHEVLLGTAEDLARLAEDLRKLADAGQGRVDHNVTREHRPDSLGAMAFEVISPQELRDLQKGDRVIWWKEQLGCVFFGMVGLLAFYGAWRLVADWVRGG